MNWAHMLSTAWKGSNTKNPNLCHILSFFLTLSLSLSLGHIRFVCECISWHQDFMHGSIRSRWFETLFGNRTRIHSHKTKRMNNFRRFTDKVMRHENCCLHEFSLSLSLVRFLFLFVLCDRMLCSVLLNWAQMNLVCVKLKRKLVLVLIYFIFVRNILFSISLSGISVCESVFIIEADSRVFLCVSSCPERHQMC